MTPEITTPAPKPADPFDDLPAVHQRRLDDYRAKAKHHAESLEGFRAIEAHYDSEIERLEAEIGQLTADLEHVPPATDSGAHGRYVLKNRIVNDELERDMCLHEKARLQPQIDEAQAAIDANAKALEAFREDLS